MPPHRNAARRSEQSTVPSAVVAAGLLAAIVGTGLLGHELHGSRPLALLWPPAGIALALVYRQGFRLLPLVFAAFVGVGLARQQWPVAVGLALGSSAAAALGAHWLHLWQVSPRFDRRRDARMLVLIAALIPMASVVNATVWLFGAGRISSFQIVESFSSGYFGELAGVLIFAPVLLAWPAKIATTLPRSHAMRFTVETWVLLSLCIILGIAAGPLGDWAFAFSFLPFIAIVRVAALRGAWPAGLHLLVVAGFLFGFLLLSTGPVQFVPLNARLPVAWGYLTALAAVSLMTACLIGECEIAEGRVRAGDANFRALVEDNPALICRFYVEGELAFANETFRRNFGVDNGMTAGGNFFALSGLDSVPDFLDRLHESRFGDSAVAADCRVVMDDDREYWFRWTARVVKESSGHGVEFHAVGLDITEQVLAEAERRQVERQAIQSQRLESVGVIAGGIAHEFNNLLTAVLGNAELAEMILPPGSEVLPLLADVRIGARRAAELSQQLLNYSIRGTRPSGPLDLSEAIRGVRDLLGVAVSRRCPLHIDLAEGLPLIAADESRIRQLLTSVVSNAGEAASDTGGAVTLRTRCVFHTPGEGPPIHGELARGWHVLVQIDDRGSGMSPEARRRVFEPFFSTKFPGRGLGLAAVLGIMLDHGGGIRVCSTEGCGTSVSMFFPPLDPAATGLGRPENAPAHDPDCRFCEPSGVVSDACAVARPPLPWCGLARTGWSSSVRSQSRRLKSQDTS